MPGMALDAGDKAMNRSFAHGDYILHFSEAEIGGQYDRIYKVNNSMERIVYSWG